MILNVQPVIWDFNIIEKNSMIKIYITLKRSTCFSYITMLILFQNGIRSSLRIIIVLDKKEEREGTSQQRCTQK